jgi:hypothetical protein
VARKPPTGGPPEGAETPSAAEVEAAIERALDVLRPRAPTGRTKPRGATRTKPTKPRPDNDA